MNFPKLLKSGVPERVGIFCSTCGTRHDLQTTGNQSCVTVGEHILQMCDTEVNILNPTDHLCNIVGRLPGIVVLINHILRVDH